MPIVVVVVDFNLLGCSFFLLIFCIHFLDFLLEIIWLIVIITLYIFPVVFTLIWWLITEYLSAVIKRVIIMLFIILFFEFVVVFYLTLHLRLIISVNWLRLCRACTNLPILSLLHFLKQTDYTWHKKRWFLHNALIFFIHQHLLDIKLPHHTLMFREYFPSI